MKMTNPLIWILVGTITALALLKSQEWSVSNIHPNRTKRSMSLVIGGTILRWMLIIAVFIYSLSHSYLATFIVFSTFMFLRLIFLLKWQGWFHANQRTQKRQ
jgi:hypothetical protein